MSKKIDALITSWVKDETIGEKANLKIDELRDIVDDTFSASDLSKLHEALYDLKAKALSKESSLSSKLNKLAIDLEKSAEQFYEQGIVEAPHAVAYAASTGDLPDKIDRKFLESIVETYQLSHFEQELLKAIIRVFEEDGIKSMPLDEFRKKFGVRSEEILIRISKLSTKTTVMEKYSNAPVEKLAEQAQVELRHSKQGDPPPMSFEDIAYFPLEGYRLKDETGRLHRFTVLAEWPAGDDEEIDIDAKDKKQAQYIAEKVLAEHYQPGGKITKIVGPRVGLYL